MIASTDLLLKTTVALADTLQTELEKKTTQLSSTHEKLETQELVPNLHR